MSIKHTTAVASIGFLLLSGAAIADDYNNITINQLPEEGQATITGTVHNVNGTQEFVLRDGDGDTIDVDTTNALKLTEGDRVAVSGMVDSEFLGIGQEINSASVAMIDMVDDTTHTDTMAYLEDDVNEEWHGGQYGAIDDLPDQGSVTIIGQVASVDRDDQSFTLRDNTEETIDVHTSQRLNASLGDQVKVSGMMTDEAAYMGEEIVSASVQVLNRR